MKSRYKNHWLGMFLWVWLVVGFPAFADLCEKVFSNPNSLFGAITRGLILRKNQKPLFDLYLKSQTPYPKNSRGSLRAVFRVLERHPELSKIPVREQILEFTIIERESPESLKSFISVFKKQASQIRNNLFQMEENWGFWAYKIWDFSSPQQNRTPKESFINYLNTTALNKKLRDFIKNPAQPYRERVITLYKALDKIRTSILAEIQKADSEIPVLNQTGSGQADSTPRGSNENSIKTKRRIYQNLSQVMTELVHTTGFGNTAWTEALKSKDPTQSFRALQNILNDRDNVAFDLGFKGHFKELKESLQTEIPDETNTLKQIREDIENQARTIREKEVLRLRALSLQESPFRACLAGDCTSNLYFDKALDPNFLYWTLTDSQNRSTGYISTVLGQAVTKEGKHINVGFVETIQGVDVQRVKAMLEGIRLSLEEQGYVLVLSKDVGKANTGLSNQDLMISYVKEEILPYLRTSFTNYVPHEHGYSFRYEDSRVNNHQNLLKFEGIKLEDVQIKSGEFFPPKIASPKLKIQTLYKPILSLEKSTNEEEQIQFLNHLLAMNQTKQLKLSDQYVYDHLNFVMENRVFSFKVRKKAFFTLIEFTMSNIYLKPEFAIWEFLEKHTSYFSEKEKATLVGEMTTWEKTTDSDYRNQFIEVMKDHLAEDLRNLRNLKRVIKSPWFILMQSHLLLWSIHRKDMKAIKELLKAGIDVNARDHIGRIALVEASHAGHLAIVRLLLKAGAKVNARDGGGGQIALVEASRNGHLAIVRLLLKAGAEVNARNGTGQIALVEASRNGHLAIVRLLLKAGAEVNATNDRGDTALMLASATGHISMVRLLLKAGADVHAKNNNGETALMWAGFEGNMDIAQILLKKRADINAENKDGYTALMGATQNGHIEMVHFLLEQGAKAPNYDPLTRAKNRRAKSRVRRTAIL